MPKEEQSNNKAEGVVSIDQDHLDDECLLQPSRYLRWAHKAAEARRDIDEAKAALEVIEAELGRKIRETPAKYGIEKDTEKAIAAAILLQDEYTEAAQTLRDAVHNANMCAAVVSALEHKKRSLTLLVELHGAGYFASPRVSEEGRDAVQQRKLKKRRNAEREDGDD